MSRVVQAEDVEFAETEIQHDENIQDGNRAQIKKDYLLEYLQKLEEHSRKNGQEKGYVQPIHVILKDQLRFTSDFSVTFAPVIGHELKEKLLAAPHYILGRSNKQLAKRINPNKLFEVHGIRLTKFQEIYDMHDSTLALTRRDAYLEGWDQFGMLLPKEYAHYHNWLVTSGKILENPVITIPNELFLLISKSSWQYSKANSLFEKAFVRQYERETKSDLRNIIIDYLDLEKKLEETNTRILRNSLYDRIKEHHPELTI